ncbi:MAG: carbonic anhydrase [Alphaproteobacteria bacterium]|nr:carbonic anhydrase [Alphaproteobacteria bacterium]MBV9202475.1 carbonic anhydrase [Alphaproteobacteria bacterium]MBV9685867.1 carbonic anhydrase [Alphaproteobacteria bacterium]
MMQSRRAFVRDTLAGAVTATASGLTSGTVAWSQPALSPEAALQQLIDGNRRFAEGRMTAFAEDLELLRAKTAERQEPFAAVLSCADSRVPVELIFDQSIGHIFVTRVAGNIATSAMIASLEYGAAVLGTRVIMVLGHANCGAVKASIEAKAVPGQISGLYPYIRPAVDQAGSDLDAAIKANARIQAGLLRQSSPVFAELIKQNRLKVVGGFYDLASGVVSLLD